MHPELIPTVRALMAADKGLLAMDESIPTCHKRFAALGIPQTEEARRAWRELIVTTPGLGESISGAILFDETMRQKTKDGRPFVECLQKAGIVPGIKVDEGAQALAGFPGEKVTEGLDGLRERLADYYQARRAVREMARGDHHRRGHPHAAAASRRTPCAGPLRGALPGSRHRPDRRAGGADGWHAHDGRVAPR